MRAFGPSSILTEKNTITNGNSGDIFNANVTTENKIVKSGRTRAMGIVLNTTAASGDFHLKDGGASGTVKFKYKTLSLIHI